MLVPQPDLFAACAAELDAALAPLHPAELTRRALQRLTQRIWTAAPCGATEDVREKMLCARRFGTAYVGKPYCMAYRPYWFKRRQGVLVAAAESHVDVTADMQTNITGAYVSIMRVPIMETHNPGVPYSMRYRAGARGIVLEEHVRWWMLKHAPASYRDPDNAGIWSRECDHDLKLVIGGKLLKVDVMGPNRQGKFVLSGRKKPTDLHLLVRPDGRRVLWTAVVGGADMTTAGPRATRPAIRLAVQLACQQAGIPYVELRDRIERDDALRQLHRRVSLGDGSSPPTNMPTPLPAPPEPPAPPTPPGVVDLDSLFGTSAL